MNSHIHSQTDTHEQPQTLTNRQSRTPTDTHEHPQTLANTHRHSTSIDTHEHSHESVILLLPVQVEWAGRVLVSLRKDLAETDHVTLPLSGHSFDELLVSYATSALEFSVVQTEVSGQCQGQSHCINKSVSLSLLSEGQCHCHFVSIGQCQCHCYQ